MLKKQIILLFLFLSLFSLSGCAQIMFAGFCLCHPILCSILIVIFISIILFLLVVLFPLGVGYNNTRRLFQIWSFLVFSIICAVSIFHISYYNSISPELKELIELKLIPKAIIKPTKRMTSRLGLNGLVGR